MDDIKAQFTLWKKTGSPEDRQELFRCLWLHYHPKLQVYARQFDGASSDMPDIASEILLKAFESLDCYNPRYSFSTWLYTLARNYLIDSYRRKKPETVALEDHEPIDHQNPESIHMKREEHQAVNQALMSLSKRDREIIYLHYYENMKYAEIAKVFGLPTGTVKYRVFEARKKLGRDLEGRLK